MKKSDIKIGMRVVPFQKTASGWGDLSGSHVWKDAKRRGQNFLYVVGFFIEEESVIVENKIKTTKIIEYTLNDQKVRGGDFFRACDFKPYIEKKNGKSHSR